MNNLKFELSVIFTKFSLSPLSGNKLIKKKYKELFRKEVEDEDLAKEIEEIIQDQLQNVVEIPEDFELNNDI